MMWLTVVLNFILLSFNYAQLSNEPIGINVLESLRASNLTCDLHTFVHSNNESEFEYESLVNDLSIYCSDSKSAKEHRILCHMVFIELKIGCSLLKRNYSWPVKYATSYTPYQICTMNKITKINRWILNKLSIVGVQDTGATSMQLCYRVTSSNETLRLARFFYKLAPHIRRADIYNRNLSLNATLPDSITTKLLLDNQTNHETENNQHMNKTRQENQLLDEKMKKDLSLQNLKSANETRADNNTQVVLDLKQIELESDIKKNNTEVNLQQSLNQTQEQTSIEVKKSEMVNPIGRLQEEPAREQVNERPKPKPLDVETAFKSNDNNNRNWIEGQNDDDKKQNEELFEPNSFRQPKVPENALINPSGTKKKLTLRSRSNIYREQKQTWSNNIVTSFLVLTLCIIIIYLILNNKNKILGLIIEGCRRRQEKHGYRYGGSSHVTRLSRLSQSI